MGKKVQDTSKEAYYSLDPNALIGLRKKIFLALQEIKTGHYEDIARKAGIDPMKCWKRLSELANDGLIHRTEARKMLSSNRVGAVWALGAAPEATKKKERVMNGKTVSDHAGHINQIKKQVLSEVKPLF